MYMKLPKIGLFDEGAQVEQEFSGETPYRSLLREPTGMLVANPEVPPDVASVVILGYNLRDCRR